MTMDFCEAADLSKLSFVKRWELCGAPQQAFAEAPQRAAPIVSLQASQRLYSAANSLLVPPKGTVFPVTMKRVEAGAPLRILDPGITSWPPPEHKGDGKYIRVDYCARVARGLEELRVGKEQKSRGHVGFVVGQGGSMPDLRREGTPYFEHRRRDAQRPKGKASDLTKLMVLGEFCTWCCGRFGSLDRAVELLGGFDNNGAVTLDAFAAALAKQGYPMAHMGAERVFSHIDANSDGVITRFEVLDATQKVKTAVEASKGRLDDLHREADRNLAASDVDDIEAHLMAKALGDSDKRTPMEKLQEKLMEKLSQQEPLLAEFFRYLYSCFKTLKAAFRHMDVNQNGDLSKAEFTDCLARLRSKDKRHFIQAHLHNIYKKLVAEGTGDSLNLAALLTTPDSQDTLINALGRFLKEALRTPTMPADSPIRTRDLEDAFHKAIGGKRALLSFQEFEEGMTRLKYADWLINQLFTRLDADASGEITVHELTCFLEPDLPRPRPESFMAAAPLGSKQRQKELLGGQSTTDKSPKLANLGAPRKARTLTSASDNSALMQQPGEDRLNVIRRELGDRRNRRTKCASDLLALGEHRFQGGTVPMKCLLPAQRCGLHFYEVEERGAL